MNTLEKYVLDLIGENSTTPDVFTDDSTGMAQIRTSLSEAIEEICMITGGHQKTWVIPLTENNGFYQLSSMRDTYAWPVSVWLLGIKKRLKQKSITALAAQSPRWLQNVGTPEVYAPIGVDKICLWPAPAADSGPLEIRGVAIPAHYTNDDDVIKLRGSHSWAAAHYAVSEYWASRGDAKTAIDSFKEYLNLMGIYDQMPEYADRRYQYKSEKKPQ